MSGGSQDRIKVKDVVGGEPVAGNSFGASASGLLSLSANAADGETVSIDANVYTFQAALTNVANNVQLGATASDSLDNLVAAINLTGTPGTQYAAATAKHPTVRAARAHGGGDQMDAFARAPGTAGNLIITLEGLGNGNWAAGTLLGGTDGDFIQYIQGPQLDVKMFYDVSDRLEYVGKATPGSPTSDPCWSIKRFVYDGGGLLTDIQWADNDPKYVHVLDDRAALDYGAP